MTGAKDENTHLSGGIGRDAEAVSGTGTGAARDEETPWPPLREELRLSGGPHTEQGAPTWTLHDPAAHRFFRVGWLEFEVLSRWRLGTTEAIRRSLARETTLNPAPASIRAVLDFALRNNLVQATGPQGTARLIAAGKAAKTSLWQKILHGYLFLRFPLVSPDRWLARNVVRIRWMFTRRFLFALIILALLGAYLVSREWVSFLLHMRSLWSWHESLLVLFSLGFAKTVHEFGHAFAAKHMGLKVPRMGVALMCFMPVLWTDVTESWKLPRRADRLLVDMSGVGAELMLATAASLVWPLLPPGDLKSAVLTLAGVTWIATLAVNANPFMRYDGYYILSDIWEMPGLQQRAFALARWRLRETIFGFGDPPPEAMPARTRRKLVLYAYITWLYRFFLFFGIALMVYHLFFKALGLALMMVELVWFIGLPIYKEVAFWKSRRDSMRYTRQLLRSCLTAAAVIFVFFVPWHTGVEGTGLLTARHSAVLYAQQPARVLSVDARPGQAVEAGQVLLQLTSPDLDARVNIARRKLAAINGRLAAASLDSELRLSYAMDAQEMQSVASELAGLEDERRRLVFTAPFAGIFRDLPAWLTPGVWVPVATRLGVVAGGEGQVVAYVAEEDMERLETGMAGLFYPVSGLFPPIRVRITALDRFAARDIALIELPTTVPGGILPARRGPEGRAVPEQAVYRVLCRADPGSLPLQSVSGKLHLKGKRRSYALRLWQAALGVFIRESGFD